MVRFLLTYFSIFFAPICLFSFQAKFFNQKDINFQTISSVQLNRIYYTYQDPNGIVWLASGQEMFRLTSTDLNNLKFIAPDFAPKSAINKMIWCNNEKFISEVSSNCIHKISNDYKSVQRICLPDSDVIFEMREYNHKIYILSKNDCGELSISTIEKNALVKIIDLPIQESINSSFLLYKGNILILTPSFLKLLDFNGNLLSTIVFPASKSIDYEEISNNLATNGKDIFMLHPSSEALLKVEIVNNKLSIDYYQNISKNTPQNIDTDQKGNFIVNWINPQGFVHFISLIFKNDICNAKIVEVKDNSLFSVGSYDIKKTIYLGGYYGLRTLEIRKNIFNNILHKISDNSSYIKDAFSMRGIQQIGHQLYMAREISSLFKLDLKTKHLDTIYIRDSLGAVVDLKFVNNLIYLKKENKLLFSTSSNFKTSDLVFYDIKTEKSEFISFPGRISTLSYDEKDKLLAIGFYKTVFGNSVLLYNIEKNQILKTRWKTKEVENYVKIIDSLIFCGSKSGLRIFHKRDGIINENLISFAKGLYNAEIYFIDKKDNHIFVGTSLRGLIVYDLLSNTVKSIDNSFGLQSNSVSSILTDSQGRIWVSTYNGLYVFSHDFELQKHFTSFDGLNNEEFNRFSNFKQSDTLYFGGINGVTQVLVPKTISLYDYDNYSVGLVTSRYNNITKIETQEYFDLLPKEITYFQNESSQKIKFSDNHFDDKKITYRIKLLGKDKEWRYPNQLNNFTFPDIEVGKFKLIIEKRLQGSHWRKVNSSTTIFFQQSFVKSRVFTILIISGLVTSLLLYLYNLYSRKIDYNLLRESIASDLHDELGSALTSISMQARFLNKDSTEGDIDAFVQENQNALQLVRDTIWSVNPDNDNVQSLIDRCSDIAFRVLNKLNIPYVIDSQLNGNKELQIDTRKEIFLIFKEAITNITKHSNPTSTKITFSQNRTNFEMQIINNGLDFKNTVGGMNMGIQNMKHRAEKMNGILEVEKNDDFFIVTLKTPKLY